MFLKCSLLLSLKLLEMPHEITEDKDTDDNKGNFPFPPMRRPTVMTERGNYRRPPQRTSDLPRDSWLPRGLLVKAFFPPESSPWHSPYPDQVPLLGPHYNVAASLLFLSHWIVTAWILAHHLHQALDYIMTKNLFALLTVALLMPSLVSGI